MKVQAIAEVVAGDSLEDVAKRYGAHPDTIKLWKAKWDRGESLEPVQWGRPAGATSAAAASKPAAEPASPSPSKPREEKPMSSKKAAAVLVTSTGEQLPPMPPQDKNAGRRVFPLDFKLAVGGAVLRKEIGAGPVGRHYGIVDNIIREWAELARKHQESKVMPPNPLATNGQSHAPAAPTESNSGEVALLQAEVARLQKANRLLREQLAAAFAMVTQHHED